MRYPGCAQNKLDLPPEAFTETPTLEDVIYVVNANTDRVRQLQTDNATLRVIDADFPIPPLRASMAYEQPRNFRLRGPIVPVHRSRTRHGQQRRAVLVLGANERTAGGLLCSAR